MDIEHIDTTLPSQGVWYGDRVPGGKIGLRETTVREDLFLASPLLTVTEKLNKIVSACARFPTPEPVDLLPTDRMAIMLFLRSITYGPKYEFSYSCNCRARNNVQVDFASGQIAERTPETIVSENPDIGSLAEPFTTTLPKSKRVVAFRHLRVSDDEVVTKRIKTDKILEQLRTANPQIDLASVVRLGQQIVSVDGTTNIVGREKDDFILGLPSMDRKHIERFLGKYETGIDMGVPHTCPNCGSENRVALPISLDFFRGESGV